MNVDFIFYIVPNYFATQTQYIIQDTYFIVFYYKPIQLYLFLDELNGNGS